MTEYERNFVLNNDDYDEEAMKKMNGIDHFVRDLTGNALKEKLYTEPSMNIQGLYREIDPVTGMPKSAAVKMDIRSSQSGTEELMRQLRNHPDAHGFEDLEIIKEGHSTLPYRGKPDSLLAKAVIKDVAEVYGMPADVHLMIPQAPVGWRGSSATGNPHCTLRLYG